MARERGRPRAGMMEGGGAEIIFAPAPDGHGLGKKDRPRLPVMRTEAEWRFAEVLRSLARFLHRFDLEAARRVSKRFGSGSISAAQISHVRLLRGKKIGINVTDFAKLIGVARSTAVEHAKGLERSKLIQAGKANLVLTRFGKEVADWVDSEEQATFYNVIAKLDGGYARTAFHIQFSRLGKIVDADDAHLPIYMSDEDVVESAKKKRRMTLGKAEPDYTGVARKNKVWSQRSIQLAKRANPRGEWNFG
jgi:DNA-binding MarR family transcriptional regulator